MKWQSKDPRAVTAYTQRLLTTSLVCVQVWTDSLEFVSSFGQYILFAGRRNPERSGPWPLGLDTSQSVMNKYADLL